MRWLGSSTGMFSIKSAMRRIFPSGETVKWYKMIWGKGCIPKLAFTLWLVVQGKLMTKDRLRKWGMLNVDPTYFVGGLNQ